MSYPFLNFHTVKNGIWMSIFLLILCRLSLISLVYVTCAGNISMETVLCYSFQHWSCIPCKQGNNFFQCHSTHKNWRGNSSPQFLEKVSRIVNLIKIRLFWSFASIFWKIQAFATPNNSPRIFSLSTALPQIKNLTFLMRNNFMSNKYKLILFSGDLWNEVYMVIVKMHSCCRRHYWNSLALISSTVTVKKCW